MRAACPITDGETPGPGARASAGSFRESGLQATHGPMLQGRSGMIVFLSSWPCSYDASPLHPFSPAPRNLRPPVDYQRSHRSHCVHCAHRAHCAQVNSRQSWTCGLGDSGLVPLTQRLQAALPALRALLVFAHRPSANCLAKGQRHGSAVRPSCIASHSLAPHRTAPHRTASHRIASHCVPHRIACRKNGPRLERHCERRQRRYPSGPPIAIASHSRPNSAGHDR